MDKLEAEMISILIANQLMLMKAVSVLLDCASQHSYAGELSNHAESIKPR